MQCLEYMKQLIGSAHFVSKVQPPPSAYHLRFDLSELSWEIENSQLSALPALLQFELFYQFLSPRSYEEDYELEDGTTPPEVKRSARYNKLVDYYGVGVVLYQIYHGRKPNNEIRNEKIQEREGIELDEAKMSVIGRHLTTRSSVNCTKKKSKCFHCALKYQENDEYIIPPNKIKIGHNFIMEDRAENTILHEDVVKSLKPSNDDQMYYLNPVGKKWKSKKKNSKSKEREKKNQDNSGMFKKSFDTKSKKSNKSKNSKKSKNSQQKSTDLSLDRSKKGLTKFISQNKKVQSKVVKVERLGSPKKMIPPRSHGLRWGKGRKRNHKNFNSTK